MAAAGSKLRGTSQAKSKALRQLVRKRRSERLKGYACIGDFCDGAYECEYVSPWTKSGCNLDAKVMVVGQDWASVDALVGDGSPDPVRARLGYNPKSPTNKNLDRRLCEHLGLVRADCYLTNMFPFVKPGKKNENNIRPEDMEHCAREYTLEEVRIVRPRLVLCLGLKTFKAFKIVAGEKKPRNMDEAVNSPFEFEGSTVYCVAHVGALGENNRGRDQVAADWQRIASFLRNVPSQPRVKLGAEKASSEY